METTVKKWKQVLRKRKQQRIFFAEIFDQRVLFAAAQLTEEDLLIPVVLASKEKLVSYAKQYNITVEHFICIQPSDELLLKTVLPFINGNRDQLQNINRIGILLVKAGLADGFVSGATYTTKEVIQPALQHIPLRDASSRVSGVLVVTQGKRQMLFADCSMHIEPNGKEFAAIAAESIETAKNLAIEPSVAFVSYTTKSSRSDGRIIHIKEAIQQIKQSYPTVPVEGELQFDAAFVPEIAAKKAPNSTLQGNATIFIFPTLEAGNIACKIMEQMTANQTFGPITQGFSKAIHDLSRGCSTKTIYEVAIYAAMQATNQ